MMSTTELATPKPPESNNPLEGVLTEDQNLFKTCGQIGFYRRQKLFHPERSPYSAQLDTLNIENGIVTVKLVHEEAQVPLKLQITAVEGNILRIKINEESPLKPRFEVPDVLVKEPDTEQLNVANLEAGGLVLEQPSSSCKIHLTAEPFSLLVTQEDRELISVNPQGQLYFENAAAPSKERGLEETKLTKKMAEGCHYCNMAWAIRKLPRTQKLSFSLVGETIQQFHRTGLYMVDILILYLKTDDLFGVWKENSADFLDLKHPSSVGLDFTLHGFENVYGLPEHADTHQLQDTKENEAYRLYNLDVFGYRVYDKMGTYGSVPLLLAHKVAHTCGIFWLNASETLVEIHSKAALQPPMHLATPDIQKQRAVPNTDIRWMSESGVVDVFLLTGPAPQDVFKQYSQLTGTQMFPPLFSLGYHQCRWNYEDEADVDAVDSGFDDHDIPYDVIWLDIEHTDGKRYFTWDPEKFPNPVKMQENLQKKRRKLVVISDPHIKVDPKYTLYTEAKEKGYFVKNIYGKDFEGNCWPGTSTYLDFTNPAVREWYSSQFSFDKYKGSTDVLFIWNDMNEPSVFKSPEQTMPKDAVHHQGWNHRDLHNLYGFYQQMSTSEGLIQRSGGKDRPFVLTRSFFAGSQRYGAVWTGDNKAEWEYLKISVPMLLTLSVTGISFCGADVGGFVGDPDTELLVRWYQAGSFQPFFRAHAMLDTKRREPWLFGENNTSIIRRVIQERYALLPFWYLLFYRAHVFSEPVMRPLWVEFPTYQDAFRVDTQYMLGNALLVAPVLEPEVTSIDVLFPGHGEYWYDFRNLNRVGSSDKQKVNVTIKEIPVYQRGGSIIPMHTTIGKSTGWMENSPYELRIALNHKGTAVGEVYIDDGHSFQYLHEHMFSYRRFTFEKNVLYSRSSDKVGSYPAKSTLENVHVMGVKKSPSEVIVHQAGGKKRKLNYTYNKILCVLKIENLSLELSVDWEIHIK
ncbi:neutral alpha-glucosidase C [Hyla sarda]|uniref:neutral alpha-glucosidase C n=1 Tax=Hyla sarda TaxID=327740 RepID=UPI0024C43115|nr:neutral alpha-glucosidase C [Hyla sarda]